MAKFGNYITWFNKNTKTTFDCLFLRNTYWINFSKFLHYKYHSHCSFRLFKISNWIPSFSRGFFLLDQKGFSNKRSTIAVQLTKKRKVKMTGTQKFAFENKSRQSFMGRINLYLLLIAFSIEFHHGFRSDGSEIPKYILLVKICEAIWKHSMHIR